MHTYTHTLAYMYVHIIIMYMVVIGPHRTGGIVPKRAADLHKEKIEEVVTLALERSGRSLRNVAGIAVTVGPGLKMCLHEGIKFAKMLAKKYQ